MPIPMPSTTIARVSWVWVEPYVIRVSSHTPAPMIATPTAMNGL